MRRALTLATILVGLAGPAAAQSTGRATSVSFLPRSAFHMGAEHLGGIEDERFRWDTHFGGELDLGTAAGYLRVEVFSVGFGTAMTLLDAANATRAPVFAAAIPMARPIPEDAPMTSTARPSRDFMTDRTTPPRSHRR